ncbi:Uncharacterised protein [Mycobacterium tuberculosis]|nr:Uncharacterised protein [Mycobacterium tuberculosis]
MDRLAAFVDRVGDHYMGFATVVGGRQQAGARLPAIA